MRAVAEAGRTAAHPRHIGPRTASASRSVFPELDCVRHLLDTHTLAAAAMRAERLDTGADRALIAMGALDEETYVRALAAHLGIAFAELGGTAREACSLTDERLIEAAAIGLAPLTIGGGAVWVIAPRHLAARGLIELIRTGRAPPGVFRLTSAAELDRFALRGAGKTVAEAAANGLSRRWPDLSAAALPGGWHRIRSQAAVAASLAALGLTLAAAPLAVEASLALFFLAWLALRLMTALRLTPRPRPLPPPTQADRNLPVYTVIAALYREASSVSALPRAIDRLDYPREKLDVLLAVESDDDETRAAIAAYAGPLPLRVIAVPDGAPRSKPRALNAALAFARGSLTVIYDAEDRTRWFKGWMQTWCVHMRAPAALWREVGPRGFIGFQLTVGGNVMAALVHPVFMGALIAAAMRGFPLWQADDATAVLAALYGLNLLTGYASSAVLRAIGLSRRGLMRSAWVLALMPLHWLPLSAAAWRALYQLIVAPYAWEKTEHGLARNSRRTARLSRSLAALEREIAALTASGLIAEINRGERRAPLRPRAPVSRARRSTSAAT